MPESPRELIANERYGEARQVLAKYRDDGDLSSPLVALEIVKMRDSIRQGASDKRWYDYSELWNTGSARYRTFLVISITRIGKLIPELILQFLLIAARTMGGSNRTGYYLTNLLHVIGITSEDRL
jgi:hypothetical protein